jgi:hypothetical protein
MECKQAHNWFANERTCAEDEERSYDYPEVRSIFTKICALDPDELNYYQKSDEVARYCEHAFSIVLELPRKLVDLMWTWENLYVEIPDTPNQFVANTQKDENM